MGTENRLKACIKEELEYLAGHRLRAMESIQANKERVARWYDKKVKAKEFTQGELVWKLILPNRNQRPEVWKMVSNMGRALSDQSMCSKKCIHPGNIGRGGI